MRILIDTNVLIDYLLTRDEFYDKAREIIVLCKNKKIYGCMAAHSVMNTFYVLRKEYKADERRKMIRALCDVFPIIAIDSNKVVSALDNECFSDVEDCLQAECAKEFSADYIVTRNVKDFKYSTIPALTPDEFLELISDLRFSEN